MHRKEKSNIVFYLNPVQIKLLADKDFSSKPIIDIARDIFLIGCYTGQRVSDYNGLKNKNIVIKNGHKFINIRQKKTDKNISIPVTSEITKIFKKYENNFPPLLIQPTLGRGIKAACKEIGITDYKLVRTHTARRSYITNQYFLGKPLSEIMLITGYKKKEQILSFIKASKIKLPF